MYGDPRNLDTYADGADDAPGYYCYGTCDGCGLVVPEDIPDDAEGLIEQEFPDERLLCRACCEGEAAAEAASARREPAPSPGDLRALLGLCRDYLVRQEELNTREAAPARDQLVGRIDWALGR